MGATAGIGADDPNKPTISEQLALKQIKAGTAPPKWRAEFTPRLQAKGLLPPDPEPPRADAAAARARRQALGAGGRSSTVLTGPSGLTGGSPTGQHKQLLGQ